MSLFPLHHRTVSANTELHTGLGCVISRGKEIIKEGNKRLPDGSTVYQAELMAIQIAMLDLAGILNEGFPDSTRRGYSGNGDTTIYFKMH